MFVVVSPSLLPVLTSTLSGSSDNRARVMAANLAASDIDEVRSLDDSSLNSTVVPIEKDVDGRTCEISREVSVVLSSGADTSSCVGTGTGSKQRSKQVSTRVETTVRGRVLPVRSDTLVKAPAYEPNSALGAIAFVVLDPERGPAAGDAGQRERHDPHHGRPWLRLLRRRPTWPAAGHRHPLRLREDRRQHVPDELGDRRRGPDHLRCAADRPHGDDHGQRQGVRHHDARRLRAADRPVPQLATPPRDGAARLVPAQLLTGPDLVFPVFPEVGGYEAFLGACLAPVATSSEPVAASSVELPLSPITVVMSTQNNNMNPGAQNRGVEVQWRGSSGCAPTLTCTAKSAADCVGPSSTGSTSACTVKVAVPAGNWRCKAAGVVFYEDATVTPKTASMVHISW